MNRKMNLDDLVALAEQPYAQTFEELKTSTRKRLVGCVPMHIPEEMVDAAGMIPVMIMHSVQPIQPAKEYAPDYFCSPVRELTALASEKQLASLDGAIVPNTCHETRGLQDVMARHSGIDWVRGLYLPPNAHSPHLRSYVVEALGALRIRLAEIVGHSLSDEALHSSIVIYNRNRLLMQKLYSIRRARPGLVSPKQMSALVVASTLMSKASHNEILEQLVAEYESVADAPTRGAVALLISGNLCAPVPHIFFELVDEAGGMVVDDDLFMGSRYFSTLVREDGDPLEALAEAYLNRVAPCPTRYRPENDWGDYLVRLVQQSQAKGVISLVVEFCEPHLYYHRLIVQKLQAAGIPELMLEIGSDATRTAQVKTRLEAFVEMLASQPVQ